MWTKAQIEQLILRSFKEDRILCPDDNAILEISHSEAATNTLVFIRCPLCAQEHETRLCPQSEKLTQEQMTTFVKRHLLQKVNECPFCRTPIIVKKQKLYGTPYDNYEIICKFCLIYEYFEYIPERNK
jgi:hypothetical protein